MKIVAVIVPDFGIEVIALPLKQQNDIKRQINEAFRKRYTIYQQDGETQREASLDPLNEKGENMKTLEMDGRVKDVFYAMPMNKEVDALAVAKLINTDRDSVTNTLCRLASRKEITRVRPGVYMRTLQKRPPYKNEKPPKPEVPTFSIETILAEFLALSNIEKANLVSKFIPILSYQDFLDSYNVSYPQPKKFDNVSEGDTLFHPMLDEVRIEKVYPEWLCFYGNGAEWKVDREGYIDGKKDKPPVLFFDLDDYIAWKRNK